MNNLHCGGADVNNEPSKSCGEVFDESKRQSYNIEDYATESHLNEIEEELEEALNPYLPGISSSPSRSKYWYRGGSKSGNTELRIAGVILNFVRASLRHKGGCKIKFTKADIARQVQNDGKPISERTVQRWLQTVLDKLACVYGLHHEVKNGAKGGVILWTEDFANIVTSHGDLFDETLLPKIRRKNEREKIERWRDKVRRETERADSILKAKAKIKTKRTSPAMMALAAKILAKHDPPDGFSRFAPSKTMLKGMLAKILSLGHWQEEARDALFRAIRLTDAALSDFHVPNPFGYCVATASNLLPNPQSFSTIKKQCRAFWKGELETFKDVMRKEKLTGENSYREGLEYYQNKIGQ